MVQRVRIADSVLVGFFLKIHFQAFPSALDIRRCCSSISSHDIFFLVPERCCISSLQHPSSKLEVAISAAKFPAVGRSHYCKTSRTQRHLVFSTHQSISVIILSPIDRRLSRVLNARFDRVIPLVSNAAVLRSPVPRFGALGERGNRT
jgi:hypothetical protein